MKKRENIVIIVVLIIMVIAIVGVSYAAFNYSRTGNINSITTGSITMTYEETDNTISLTGALPTTDKTGMVRMNPGEYFDFSISSEITGDVNINYEISAKDITTSDRKIDGSNIKLYLTKLTGDNEEALMVPEVYNEETSENTYTGRPSGEMSLYTSSMNSSESNNYRLRMYVDEAYNPQGDGGGLQFTVQINVYGKAGLSMQDRMMMAYDSSNPSDFHTDEYKSSITSIVTKGDTVIPEGVIESWDISEKQNGSVIAYIEDDGTGSSTYKVTIGAQDNIIANYDMSYYFSSFTNLTSMDLRYLNTSLTTNMNSMFYCSTSLTELDLSSFDTSNVTSMSAMFSGDFFIEQSMSLNKINFGENFDTSNVTNMSDMFVYCTNLVELDLSNFDTSNVTYMTQMFKYCSSLTELNLSNFNTSNVTIMSGMFSNCTSLKELNLSSLDTSNVTNMFNMFSNCSSLTSLDLRSFDTSKVTTYINMFNGMTNITEILVTRDTWTIPNSTIRNSGVTDFTYV